MKAFHSIDSHQDAIQVNKSVLAQVADDPSFWSKLPSSSHLGAVAAMLCCLGLFASRSNSYGQGVILHKGDLAGDEYVKATEFLSFEVRSSVVSFMPNSGSGGTIVKAKVIEVLKYPDLTQNSITTDEDAGALEKVKTDFEERSTRFPRSNRYLQPWIQKLGIEIDRYRRDGKVKVRGSWISKGDFEGRNGSEADVTSELTIAGKTYKEVKLRGLSGTKVTVMHDRGVAQFDVGDLSDPDVVQLNRTSSSIRLPESEAERKKLAMALDSKSTSILSQTKSRANEIAESLEMRITDIRQGQQTWRTKALEISLALKKACENCSKVSEVVNTALGALYLGDALNSAVTPLLEGVQTRGFEEITQDDGGLSYSVMLDSLVEGEYTTIAAISGMGSTDRIESTLVMISDPRDAFQGALVGSVLVQAFPESSQIATKRYADELAELFVKEVNESGLSEEMKKSIRTLEGISTAENSLKVLQRKEFDHDGGHIVIELVEHVRKGMAILVRVRDAPGFKVR